VNELAPLRVTTKATLVTVVAWHYVRVRCATFRADLPTALVRIRRTRGDHQPVSMPTAERYGRAVARTLQTLPADSRCLMQAMVLTSLLARRGTATQLVIAVRPGQDTHGFGAHAWVELHGQALLPTYDEEFTRLTVL
jgi:hypothetical protein